MRKSLSVTWGKLKKSNDSLPNSNTIAMVVKMETIPAMVRNALIMTSDQRLLLRKRFCWCASNDSDEPLPMDKLLCMDNSPFLKMEIGRGCSSANFL